MKAPLFDANFRGGVCPLSNEQIQTYIDSGEPFGKAGAYGIQGGVSAFIPQISGSYSGIMGLPLYETAQLLKRAQAQTP